MVKIYVALDENAHPELFHTFKEAEEYLRNSSPAELIFQGKIGDAHVFTCTANHEDRYIFRRFIDLRKK